MSKPKQNSDCLLLFSMKLQVLILIVSQATFLQHLHLNCFLIRHPLEVARTFLYRVHVNNKSFALSDRFQLKEWRQTTIKQ